ncbi:MAG: GGDEF domain-containing protein [Sphingomicrobium sp.]
MLQVINPGETAGADMDRVVCSVDTEALMEEIARLRGEVVALKARVDELDGEAHRDVLVPVSNRRGLVRHLDLLIARFERHDIPAALLFVDVDGLKALNDSFGHAAGDAALVYLARLMVDGVRQTDVVGRLGGDEFAILLDHANEESAMDTANRLVNAVADSDFVHQGQRLPLSVAIGITEIVKGDTAEAVLDRADREMYRDKAVAAA